MQEVLVNTVIDTVHQKPGSLPLSLRLVRLTIGMLLIVAIATELLLPVYWQFILSVLAFYTFITAVFGRDPLFSVLRLSLREPSDHALSVAAQVECFAIGLICIVAGIMNRNMNSLVMTLLPFLGIYPILLCAVKHDLLSYLLQSYRKNPHS